MKLLLMGLFLLSCSDTRRVKYPDVFWVGFGEHYILRDTSSLTTWGYCDKEVEDCISDVLDKCELAKFSRKIEIDRGWMVNCVVIKNQYCGVVSVPNIGANRPKGRQFFDTWRVDAKGNPYAIRVPVPTMSVDSAEVCCSPDGCTRINQAYNKPLPTPSCYKLSYLSRRYRQCFDTCS